MSPERDWRDVVLCPVCWSRCNYHGLVSGNHEYRCVQCDHLGNGERLGVMVGRAPVRAVLRELGIEVDVETGGVDHKAAREEEP